MDVIDFDSNEEVTNLRAHRPKAIDEYTVIVNLPEDWNEVHNLSLIHI